MPVYRVTLQAWNHTAGPTHDVRLAIRARDTREVRTILSHHTIYASDTRPERAVYNLTGGFGPGGTWLDEWTIVSIRKTEAQERVRVWCSLSLCVDCMLTLANGECGERADDLPVPLCKVAGEDVSPGTLGHAEGCTQAKRESNGCDCEDLGFCTTTCNGCGDWHHGDRFAAVIFRQKVGDLWIERI